MPNRFDDLICRCKNFVVPAAQHLKAISIQPKTSLMISRRMRREVVLSAVDLDNQPAFKTDKVYDVDTQPMLTPEVIT